MSIPKTMLEVEAHNARIAAGRSKNSLRCDVGEFGGKAGSERREAEIHAQIEAGLKRRRFYYVHSRTDRRTTTQLGVTDFIIAMPDGKTLWLEVKRKGGKLRPEQVVTRHVLLALGHRHEVAYSFEQFIEILKG